MIYLQISTVKINMFFFVNEIDKHTRKCNFIPVAGSSTIKLNKWSFQKGYDKTSTYLR